MQVTVEIPFLKKRPVPGFDPEHPGIELVRYIYTYGGPVVQ